jgi:DNA-binding NarL/FixJ family response regulator
MSAVTTEIAAKDKAKPIRVLIADDHHLVRAGLHNLIGSFAEIKVVAEAADGREAVTLTELHRPNLVLMDIQMPSLNGLEATRRIVRTHPQIAVLVLSMHTGEDYVFQAFSAGARGYVIKEAAPFELELAIRAVHRGEVFISPALSGRVVELYLDSAPAGLQTLERLSPRQREVLQLIAEGKSTKQIAAMLDASIKTVEAHRAQLMLRLGIHDVPGLVRYAIRHGLVSSES